MGYETPMSVRVDSAELVELLTVTQRALTRELASCLDEESISVEQWRVLRAVDVEDGRQMGDLSLILETPAPTLTRLVDGLIDTSYLYRTQSSQDRRKISVHLADHGRELLARLDAIALAHEAAISRRIGVEAAADLLEGLRAIRNRPVT